MSGSNKNTYYTATDIEKYLNGELSASEMHALEKASLEDPFLGDALEGMKKDRLNRGTSFSDKDIPELKKRLEERIGRGNRRDRRMSSRYLSWRVAASVVLLAGLGAFSYFSFFSKISDKRSLAVNKETRPETKMASGDTAAEKPGAQKTIEQKAGTSIVRNSQPIARNTGKTVVKKQGRNMSRARTLVYRDSLVFAEKEKGERGAGDEKTREDLAEAMPGVKTDSVVFNAPLPSLNNSMPSPNNKNVFTGRVTGIDDKPIAFATIRLKNRSVSTTTDSSGLFRLYFAEPDTLLDATISSVGYEALTTALRSNWNLQSDADLYLNSPNIRDKPDMNAVYKNEIRLQPTGMALNDVVVRGYGLSKSKRMMTNQSPQLPSGANTELAGKVAGVFTGGKQKDLVRHTEPSIGWAAYNSWIGKNKRIRTADSLLTGNEVISFFVNRGGGYSSFRVEHSLSAAHDAEAIRLVREGPAWRLLNRKRERVTLIIPF